MFKVQTTSKSKFEIGTVVDRFANSDLPSDFIHPSKIAVAAA